MSPKLLCQRIADALTPDLLSPMWRAKVRTGEPATAGHCYIAAELAYHLLGGKAAGYLPYVLNHACWPEGLDPGETHWFIRHRDGTVVDPTSSQFSTPIAYDRGRACGFLTLALSKRGRTLRSRIGA